jgi:hypothetical protein
MNCLKHSEYSKLFVVAQDLSRYKNALTSERDILESKNIGIDIKFSEALSESVTILLYLIYDGDFSIDGARNVHVLY